MKKNIVKSILATATGVIMIGCNTMTVGNEAEQTTQTATVQTVQNSIKYDSVEIYHTTSKEDFDNLTPVLENRNGKIIIEVVHGIVLDDNGTGEIILTDGNACDFYIEYDTERFSKGDTVQTVFVYNPDTNFTDDIIYRADTLL